jgi:hypothetical protein
MATATVQLTSEYFGEGNIKVHQLAKMSDAIQAPAQQRQQLQNYCSGLSTVLSMEIPGA